MSGNPGLYSDKVRIQAINSLSNYTRYPGKRHSTMKFFPVLFVACVCVKGALSSKFDINLGKYNSSLSTPTIPDDVLQVLKTLLNSDALEISPSACWLEILEPLNMQERVAQWANRPALLGLGYTRELLQLYELMHCPWVRPEQVYGPYSRILPQSWITVEWAVESIQQPFQDDAPYKQSKCFQALIDRLIKHKYFELLAHLLKRIQLNSVFTLNSEYISMYQVGKIDSSILLNMMMEHGIEYCELIFSAILFAPVSEKTTARELALLLQLNRVDSNGKKEYISYEKAELIMRSICGSCELEFEAHSVEVCASIHERNIELINLLQSSMPFKRISDVCAYASLLNGIRFGPVSASIQEEEIRSCIRWESEIGISYREISQGCPFRRVAIREKHKFFCELMFASVRAQKLELFEKMVSMAKHITDHGCYFAEVMCCFFDEHSDFMRRLSIACCKELLMMKCASLDVIRILQQAGLNALVLKNINVFTPVMRFSAVMTTEIGGTELATNIAKSVLTKNYDNILRDCLLVLVDKFEDPLPLLARSLPLIDPKQPNCMRYIERALENEKILRALLKAESDDPIFEILSESKIPLSTDFAKKLLEDDKLATAFDSWQGEFIRDRLYFSPARMVYLNDLCYEQVSRLFEILRVPIHPDRFKLQIDDDSLTRCNELLNNDGALKDIEFADKPGFFAILALAVYSYDLQSRIYGNYESEFASKDLPKSVSPNLLTLKSISMLVEWFKKDEGSFQRFGPAAVVRILCPLAIETVAEIIRTDCTEKMYRQGTFELFVLYPRGAELAASLVPPEEFEAFNDAVNAYFND